MPNRFEWHERIKDVEREHSAARLAIDRLTADADHDPNILIQDVSVRVLRRTSDRLEGTYIIRLFAEFETCLRGFWAAARGTSPPSRTRDLIDGIAAKRHIPNDGIEDAHSVREFRNALIHQRDNAPDPVPIAAVRNHLGRFLKFLPPDW